MRLSELHDLLSFLFVAAGALVFIFWLRLIRTAARTRRSARILRDPIVKPISWDDLSYLRRQLASSVHEFLIGEGFVPVAAVGGALAENRIDLCMLMYLSRATGTRGSIWFWFAQAGTIFVTEFEGNPLVRTSNVPRRVGDDAAEFVLTETPACELLRVHRQRVAEMCPGRQDWILPREGEEVPYLLGRVSAVMSETVQSIAGNGCYEPDGTGRAYLPTHRAALAYAARHVWPFCAFSRHGSGQGFDVLMTKK